MSEAKFSVYQFFPDDTYEHVLCGVSAEKAVICASGLSRSVGAQIGTTRRVIITDSGDSINWEWVFGKGVVFPSEQATS